MWNRMALPYRERPVGLKNLRDRATVLYLVEECFRDTTVAGVLADLMDEEYPDMARMLREDVTVGVLVEALHCGDWRSAEVASTARGFVLRHAMLLSESRIRLPYNPFESGEAEALGLVGRGDELAFPCDRCEKLVYPTCPSKIAAYTRRSTHCQRLIWNGLYGWPTPDDCQPMVFECEARIALVVRNVAGG